MSEIEVQWLGRVDYGEVLTLQSELVRDYLEGKGREQLLLLEHEPVYTIGRTRDRSSLQGYSGLPYPVFEINRGGQATWHGPGQLVAYPLLDLQRFDRDLHRYMRFLEELIIDTSRRSGIECSRREGLTGVWINGRKIASIGVGVRRWISMHGLALNVTNQSLAAFRYITPCGIAGVQMTCLEAETQSPQAVDAIARTLASVFMQSLPTPANIPAQG